jgi:hypothetical protein
MDAVVVTRRPDLLFVHQWPVLEIAQEMGGLDSGGYEQITLH